MPPPEGAFGSGLGCRHSWQRVRRDQIWLNSSRTLNWSGFSDFGLKGPAPGGAPQEAAATRGSPQGPRGHFLRQSPRQLSHGCDPTALWDQRWC